MEERIYTKGSKITLSQNDQIKVYALDKALSALKLILILMIIVMILISLY